MYGATNCQNMTIISSDMCSLTVPVRQLGVSHMLTVAGTCTFCSSCNSRITKLRKKNLQLRACFSRADRQLSTFRFVLASTSGSIVLASTSASIVLTSTSASIYCVGQYLSCIVLASTSASIVWASISASIYCVGQFLNLYCVDQ